MDFYRVLQDFVVAIQLNSPQRTFYAHADSVDTWVEIRGYGYGIADGMLRGRWIWADPNPQAHLGADPVAAEVDTSTMPSELPCLTVDQLNMRIARPFLCRHKSGRWLLYDPLLTNPAERAEVARQAFGMRVGGVEVTRRRTRRRGVAVQVLYQHTTRRRIPI